jgi:hypothetical protein
VSDFQGDVMDHLVSIEYRGQGSAPGSGFNAGQSSGAQAGQSNRAQAGQSNKAQAAAPITTIAVV